MGIIQGIHGPSISGLSRQEPSLLKTWRFLSPKPSRYQVGQVSQRDLRPLKQWRSTVGMLENSLGRYPPAMLPSPRRVLLPFCNMVLEIVMLWPSKIASLTLRYRYRLKDSKYARFSTALLYQHERFCSSQPTSAT